MKNILLVPYLPSRVVTKIQGQYLPYEAAVSINSAEWASVAHVCPVFSPPAPWCSFGASASPPLSGHKIGWSWGTSLSLPSAQALNVVTWPRHGQSDHFILLARGIGLGMSNDFSWSNDSQPWDFGLTLGTLAELLELLKFVCGSIVPSCTDLMMESTHCLQESRIKKKRMWVAKQTDNWCQVGANI